MNVKLMYKAFQGGINKLITSYEKDRTVTKHTFKTVK